MLSMRTAIFKFFCFISFIGILAGCKKETEVINFDYAYNYFPDDSGKYVVYKVDSVLYNDFDPYHIKRYSSIYLKEVVTEQFIDNLGRNAKKLERFYTSDTSLPWQTGTVWYFVKNTTNVEQVEDNIRYVKLTFPPEVNNYWHGNKYFKLNQYPFQNLRYTTTNFDWTYTITELNTPFSNNNFYADSSLTVVQIDDSSNVQRVYSIEKYAKNIGLVYKELWRLDAQLVNNQNFTDHAKNGFIVRQTAIKYGFE